MPTTILTRQDLADTLPQTLLYIVDIAREAVEPDDGSVVLDLIAGTITINWPEVDDYELGGYVDYVSVRLDGYLKRRQLPRPGNAAARAGRTTVFENIDQIGYWIGRSF